MSRRVLKPNLHLHAAVCNGLFSKQGRIQDLRLEGGQVERRIRNNRGAGSTGRWYMGQEYGEGKGVPLSMEPFY